MFDLARALLISLCVTCGHAAADDAGSARQAAAADGPTPYPKDAAAWSGEGAIRVFDWMSRDRQAFWREREAKQYAVVFAGDSLIGGWKTLERDFPGMKVANRGIGGDVSRGLVFRWKEDVLDLRPKAVVLLVGTNDLSARQDTAATAANIAQLLDTIARLDHAPPVVLCTLPPRDDPKAPIPSAELLQLNRKIETLASGRRQVAVLDLYRLFTTADGALDERFLQPDRLHLNPAGYGRFRDALVPILDKFNVH